MSSAVPDILARIVAHKQQELATSERRRMRNALEKRISLCRPRQRDFHAALLRETPSIIAEIKKASPSKGVLVDEFWPGQIAEQYRDGGAAALSVLTDMEFFRGTLSDLFEAKFAANIPALRKDFLIDEFQIVEAAAYGADAILLIAAILDVETMRRFREQAAEYNLAALVEVHNEEELAKAVDSGASIIGVNNRDLRTFEVNLETSLRLAERMPEGAVKVTESGIESAEQVRLLSQAGYHAFLVGEHLMRSEDPIAALRALRA